MNRFQGSILALVVVALLSGLGCNQRPVTETVAVTPAPVAEALSVDAGATPAVDESAVGESETAVDGASGPPPGGAGGSEGAPLEEPVRCTREEFVELINKNEALRADIRATNPKLQLIIDGKFDEFEKLLDKEPRLATVRWGYYEDKPDPLNPLNPPPRGGPTALHLAAEHGSLELVKRLAQPEVVELANADSQSPLCLAANVEIAQVLLDAGAKLAPDEDVSGLGSPMPMRGAAERGDLALCKWLRENGAKLDMETTNGQHWRPIGFACEHGNLDVVKWMHQQGVSLQLLPGTSPEEREYEIYNVGSTPLARAAAGGQVDVIEYLLANGAEGDLNLRTEVKPAQPWHEPKPIEFSPALCRAAAEGHVEAVQLLLDEGAMLKSVNGLGPLHMAALNGRQEIFHLLLQRGAKIATDKYVTRVEEVAGIDLLCCAVRGGNVEIFRQVVNDWPTAWVTDEECSDRYSYYRGRGPIAVAVSAEHESLVRHMIERLEAGGAPRPEGRLNHALATAVETDQVGLVQLLHDAGVPLDAPLVSPSPGGQNALQSIIARAGAHGSCNVLRHLVEQGVDVDTRDKVGRTVLHQVCRKEFAPVEKNYADLPFRMKVIGCLIELGASPKAKDDTGRTVLHDAVYYLEPAEISLLLNKRATPMVHDRQGESPAAQLERLLAGDYKGDAEPRPWEDQYDLPPDQRTPWSWRERIRCEENLKRLE